MSDEDAEESVAPPETPGVRLRNAQGAPSGRPTAPAEARIFKESRANTWVELTITEGRNHQVKRMCDAVGLRVIRLIRVEFGGISIDPLPAGGDALGVILGVALIVFLVLLITDIMGYTDIFPFVKKTHR